MADSVNSRREERRQKKEEKRRLRKEKKNIKREKQRKLLFPADKKGRHKMRLMDFLRVLLYPWNCLFYPHRLHGSAKVGQGAYIYVSNHYCMWDLFYCTYTTDEGVHFLAKQSLMEKPVVGLLARKLGAIGAMRDGSDIRSVMECIKVLKNGEKLCIFPEGTRNKNSEEEFLPFKGGAAMLAIKTKTPIVPYVICSRPRLFRVTHVVFGEPMEFSEYYGKKLSSEELAEAEAKIVNELYELRARYRAGAYAKKKRKD